MPGENDSGVRDLVSRIHGQRCVIGLHVQTVNADLSESLSKVPRRETTSCLILTKNLQDSIFTESVSLRRRCRYEPCLVKLCVYDERVGKGQITGFSETNC